MPAPHPPDELDGFAGFLARIGRTPLLTPAEEIALARRIERGDLAAKQLMVESNLRLVVHVAKRFQREDHGMSLADLVQEGTLGLVRATEKYDHRRGYRFSTYATIWIRQSIGRAIIDKGRTIRLPVHMGQRLRTLEREERLLTTRLGRPPSAGELATALGWRPDEVQRARGLQRSTISLDEPVGHEEGAELGALLEDDGAAAPDARAEAALQAAAVRAALARLPSRERAVLEARYGVGRAAPATVAETARLLRLRPRDVRRLEELGLRKLRAAPETAATLAA
jgi:RNA polymerase primary sigma factor